MKKRGKQTHDGGKVNDGAEDEDKTREGELESDESVNLPMRTHPPELPRKLQSLCREEFDLQD